MGNLPSTRLSPFARPFTYTGVDYVGPFNVTNGRKTEKRWEVLFTCLTVRAVHIEVAHSLTTSSCILAFRNFIALRGIPNIILSDKGTNFVGAERELRESLQKNNQDELIDEINIPSINWSFNPPGAPYLGGAWERLIQSVKKRCTELVLLPHRLDMGKKSGNHKVRTLPLVSGRSPLFIP